MVDGRCPDMSAVDILEATQRSKPRTGTAQMPTVHIYWRHMANTIEPSVCGGDAVFCQISLIFDTLLYYISWERKGIRDEYVAYYLYLSVCIGLLYSDNRPVLIIRARYTLLLHPGETKAYGLC